MDNNERILTRLEARRLEPIEPERAERPCIRCECEADLKICGDLYCNECAYDEFYTFADEYEFCDFCEEELDGYYRVGNEKLCEDCFRQNYQL